MLPPMTAHASRIDTLLTAPALDIDALAAQLEALGEPDKIAAVRRMNGRVQARLWQAAQGRSTSLSDLVPEGIAPGIEVIHAGKNSLPMFTHFEKRFCRASGHDDRVYGYNEGSTRKLVGPGYFVAYFYAERGEVGVNYYDVPPAGAQLPPGWPAIRVNESGLQRFVYAKMVDYLRKVSDTVTIGRAVRGGKETGNYFLLCRTGG
jgi:hypothetical protein